MDISNLTSVYNQNPSLQSQYTLQQYLDLFGGSSTGNTGTTGNTTQTQTTTPANQGIIGANINQYQTGGDDFSVYNPDPTKVRTDYRPDYDYRKHIDYNPNLTATANEKQFDMYQNYYNKPAPSGIEQFIGKAINFIPYIGPLKRGAEFVGGAIKGMFPVNQRGILENELRGSGILTDDIGRMVGDPNTVEGVMAGYNASADPFKENNVWDKRKETIAETVARKYGIEIDDDFDFSSVKKGDKGYDLINRYNLIAKNQFIAKQKNKKAKDIADFRRKEKERKAFEAAKAKQITTVPTQLGGGDGQSGGDYAGGAAFAAANPYGGSGTMDDLGADSFRKGGRVGLENGGAPVYSESDFPKLLSPFRPTSEKPSLSDYDEDIWDYDVIEIPMGGKMKRYKKFKKRKGGRGRRSRSYFNGGLVSLRRR